jgi:hypothetical protein
MISPVMSLLIVATRTALFWGILGAFAMMVVMYLLVARHVRGRVGVQPGYRGLFIMLTAVACTSAMYYVAKRAGVDLLHGRPRDIFWLVLATVWAVMSVRVTYERRSSGKILMDLGPAPLAKMHVGLAVLMAVMAIVWVVSGDSPAQALAYGTWAIWLLVAARGRLQIREHGISTVGLLRWQRISQCVSKGPDRVHLHLNKGWQRDIKIKVPADVRDEFVRIVEERAGATA